MSLATASLFMSVDSEDRSAIATAWRALRRRRLDVVDIDTERLGVDFVTNLNRLRRNRPQVGRRRREDRRAVLDDLNGAGRPVDDDLQRELTPGPESQGGARL